MQIPNNNNNNDNYNNLAKEQEAFWKRRNVETKYIRNSQNK